MNRIVFVALIVAGGACAPASDLAGPTGQCDNNDQCEAGSICKAGACEELCLADFDCPGLSACFDGVCATCTDCRELPQVDALDGAAAPDGDHHRVHSSVVLYGQNLDGVQVALSGPGFDGAPLAACGSPAPGRVEVMLPDTVAPGDYVLTVSNQAGSCDATMQLLRGSDGRDGPPGSYTIGNGLRLTGTTLSVDASVSDALDDLSAARGASSLVARLNALESQLSGQIPVGTILPFAGPNTPTGWLLCDGSELSRTSHAALFDVVGSTWGGGDLVSTFNLPDLRGRFLRGVDAGAGVDPDAAARTPQTVGGQVGDNVGTIQDWATGTPANTFATDVHQHKHGITNDNGKFLSLGAGGTTAGASAVAVTVTAVTERRRHTGYPITNFNFTSEDSHSHSLTGGDNETRPANANVHYVIKF